MYDNLITIADEIQFIWKQDFSGRTVIFFVNRYFTLLVIILCIIGTAVGKVSILLHPDRSTIDLVILGVRRVSSDATLLNSHYPAVAILSLR